MKRFLIAFAVELGVIVIVHQWLFKGIYDYHHISDAIFVVSLFTFFYGLLSLTHALEVFDIVSYSFKQLRRKNRYRSYFEYKQAHEKEGHAPYAIELLIISGILICVSYVLSRLAL